MGIALPPRCRDVFHGIEGRSFLDDRATRDRACGTTTGGSPIGDAPSGRDRRTWRLVVVPGSARRGPPSRVRSVH
jgi:hypothetical protein